MTFEEWYKHVKTIPPYKVGVPDICTIAYYVLKHAYGEGIRRAGELKKKIDNKIIIACDGCEKEISGGEVFVRDDGLSVCAKCCDDMAGA